VVAGLHQGVEDEELRAVAGCRGKCRRAAFKRCNAVFQHCLRRVHDARIDVAEFLQAEQARGMVHVIKDIGRGLVDRRGAGAGGGVRRGAGMDGAGGKALFAHEKNSLYGLNAVWAVGGGYI